MPVGHLSAEALEVQDISFSGQRVLGSEDRDLLAEHGNPGPGGRGGIRSGAGSRITGTVAVEIRDASCREDIRAEAATDLPGIEVKVDVAGNHSFQPDGCHVA